MLVGKASLINMVESLTQNKNCIFVFPMGGRSPLIGKVMSMAKESGGDSKFYIVKVLTKDESWELCVEGLK